MTCKLAMIPNPKTVKSDDPVGKALELMVTHGIRSVPVVDDQEHYQGSFTSNTLLKILLPKAATVEGGLTDLTFVHDTVADMRERLNELRDHPISEYIDIKDLPVVHPDTSIIEGILLIYQHRVGIPVVDENDRLVGIITGHSTVRAIVGDE